MITEEIFGSDEFKRAEQVLIFASTGTEFDTSLIADECRKTGKRLFYPKCTDKNGRMTFYLVSDADDLECGMYKIFEPKSNLPEYAFENGDIILVPALSVDKNFMRIGYGKGYYDRFLQNFQGVSICPCYKEMMTRELPTDEFDIQVDVIATETGFYRKEDIL